MNVRLTALLLVLLMFQGGFWHRSHGIAPYLGIVPEPPAHALAATLTLGDTQFAYRIYALQLQNFGDSFGRNTPLADYDYDRLSRWFRLMDTLDDRANFVPSLASYYFSQTPNRKDVRYIIRYLETHAARYPEKKWWWLAQAVYLAKHKLNDYPEALRLAHILAATPGDLPIWTRQMPAFIHEDLGETEAALAIIQAILRNADNLDDKELNFMEYFIRERLGLQDIEGNATPPTPTSDW